VEFVSASQITAVAPAGAAGARAIVVTNADTQPGALASGVQYVVAPAVVSVSPSMGGLDGGTLITIVGTNFADGLTVSFGDVKASDVILVDAQTLTVLSPPDGEGAVTVSVADKDGLSAGGSAVFVYGSAAPVTEPPHFTLGIPPTNGIGLIAFSGGTSEELATVAEEGGCLRVALSFFAAVDGRFIVFIPAAPSVVNAAWGTHFADGIPANLPLVMRCG
jgi:hypothetical protein